MVDDSDRDRERILKREQLVLRGEPVSVPVGSPASRPPGRKVEGQRPEPELEVVRAPDGSVAAIVVQCTCGRRITLECDYLLDSGGDNETMGS